MSRQFGWLLRVQLLGVLPFGRQKGKGLLRFWALGVLYVGLAAMLLWYCYMLAAGLGMIGLSRLIPLYAITLGSLVTIFFTFLKANGVLFGCRDYELLTALPVPTVLVISSRFVVMYLFNMALSVGVMAAMGIAYAPYADGMATWVFWVLGALLASLIPTTAASLAAALVAAVSSRFRYSNVVTIVISLVLTFGVLGLTMQVGRMEDSVSVATVAALGDQMAAILTRVYPPAGWFGRAVSEGSAVSFAAFVGASFGIYLVFAFGLSAMYQRVQNGLTAHGASREYKVGRLGSRSALAALYQKEWKGFLSSPIYVLNMGIGMLMAVAASAALCFMGPETLLGVTNVPGLESWFSRLVLFIPVVILPMSNTACVSLSLEGDRLWILKSLPVGLREVFLAKILVNLTVGLPGALLSCLFLWAGTKPAAADALAMLALSAAVVCLTSVGGIWINLKFPVYEWKNQMQVVKQSASSMCGVLGGLAIGVGLAFAAVKWQQYPLWMIGVAECLAVAAVTLVLWGRLLRVKRL